MSDVDSLVAAFQSQLSEVMETLVKTAMYEVTRLVEDGLLEQLKSRSHEVECLKVQLQLTQRTPPGDDRDGASGRRKSDLNASPPYGAEDGPNALHPGVVEECGLKQEIGLLFLDHRIRSCRQDGIANLGTAQLAEHLTPSLCLLRDSQFCHPIQAVEKATEKPAVVIKLEGDVKPPCSIKHQEGLDVDRAGGSGSPFHSLEEITDFQSSQTQKSSKELSGTTVRQGGHSFQNTFAEDQEHFVSHLDMDSERGGLSLLQNHTPSTANDTDSLSDSAKQMGRDKLKEPVSSAARLQISHAGDVVIKQEILLDSDEDQETLGDQQFVSDSQNCLPMVSIKAHYQAQSGGQHVNMHAYPGSATQGPRNRCGQCGRCFADWTNLRAHLQTHTGTRSFCCAVCGRSFTKLSNLKAHRRVHTGERPYCCMACGKGFTQKCNLKRHQRIHLNV